MIVKRSVKGRIRMELRICEVDKGGAARVTNTREAGPFPSASSGTGFHCTLNEFVELAVIRCSATRFESDESVALRQTQGPGFIVRSVSLSNWPLLFAEGPVKSCQSGALRSGKKIMVPPITVILCESRESRNTSSKEKTDPSSAVLTLTHISLRAGCFSDG